MGKTVDGENDSNSATSGKSPKTDPDIPVEADTAAPGAHIKWQPDGYKGIQCPFPVADGVDTHISRLEQDMGRLVLKEDGRTRYVNNSFWAGLKAEVSVLYIIMGIDSMCLRKTDMRTSCRKCKIFSSKPPTTRMMTSRYLQHTTPLLDQYTRNSSLDTVLLCLPCAPFIRNPSTS